jgi:DivIVA domain-containing protein
LREELEPEATSEFLVLAASPELVPADLRDVSFTVALRGYNRAEVDAYVESANRVIAELEVSRSPQSAVKLALDRVGEQTASILQRAREAAEELTSTTLAESEHASRRARVEAAELMERAQDESRVLLERASQEAEDLQATSLAQLEELHGEIEEARRERRRVLAQLRTTAAALEIFATEAEGETPRSPDRTSPATDAPEDFGEQPTEVAPAVASSEDGEADEDPDGAAPQARTRRPPPGARQPRAPKRETTQAGRARRD